MFRYVKLQNYKSIVNLEVDLTNKRNSPKNIVLIYGENGVGKSNFASAFYTLWETLRTKSIKEMFEHFINTAGEDIDKDTLQSFLQERLHDTESIIKNSKTLNSQGNMSFEFGFRINGRNGVYYLETDDTRIVNERLEYVINKNKTVFFQLSNDSFKLNPKIIIYPEYHDELINMLKKYWGKHSFLSLLVYDIEDKTFDYVKKRISERFYEVISFFMTMSIKVKSGNRSERGNVGLSHKILGQLDHGKIPLREQQELDKAETMLNSFFTHIYSDVKEVFYKRSAKNDVLHYELYLKKKIYNNIVDVNFELESTGTQNLLELIPYFLASVEGYVVIIDELDTGIHDLLVNNLLVNLADSINGQVIITTHNTMLLESDIDKDNVYIFQVDKNSNKELIPLSLFENRLHPNLNIRKRYLKGIYGGVPLMMDVDFEELVDLME